MSNPNTSIPDAFYEHFNADKPTKIGGWLVRTSYQMIFDLVRPDAGSNVLEIGPGRGPFADLCLQKGIQYFAVEPNAAMAESLEKRGATVVRAMVPPLPEMGRSFDLAVMLAVLEHMNTMREALEIVQQIGRALKPGGKILVYVPDYINMGRNFFNCDFSHNYVTTRRRVSQLLTNAGYRNVKSYYLSGPVRGLPCVVLTGIVARMPFGFLNAIFPNNRVIHKLYKLQLTFSRKVIVVAEWPS